MTGTINATTIKAIKLKHPESGVDTFVFNSDGTVNFDDPTVIHTTGSYSDPSWLSISKTKVGLGNVDDTSDATKTQLVLR